MLLFTERCTDAGHATTLSGSVSLPFELRQRSRLRVEPTAGRLAGSVVGFDLPRGTILRDGDRVRCASGEVLRIDAAPEALVHVVADSPQALARMAYHLGNRHVPVQVGEGWLRLQADPVLEAMVAGLGAAPVRVEAPFEPEAGAYGHGGHGGHAHSHGADGRHAPQIHDLLADRATR
jgi:urease accessory protein